MSKAPGVTVGNAGKIAADLVVAAIQSGQDINAVIGLWSSTTDLVVGELAGLTSDGPAPEPQAPAGGVQGVPPAIANAFPGTTVEPQQQVNPGGQQIVPPGAQSNVVPLPTGGPAPIPGVQAQAGGVDPDLEEAWQVFFNDVNNNTFAQNWDDNRQQKAQGGKYAKIPDFKHKSWTRPGAKYPVGLYINDKKAPAWVAGALAQIGIS